MDNKLFTVIEVALIGGLIIFVLYLGGVFNPAPTATPPPGATTEPTPESTSGPTRTPRPTRTPTPVTPTPTTPPLTEPTGLVAFNSTRTGNTEVFIVNADGSGLRNLTNHPAEDYVLTWSPDGSRLAFFSTRTNWLELYVIEVASGNLIQLTNTQALNTAYSYPISWSPDGQYILSGRASPWLTGGYMRSVALDLIRTDGTGTQTVYTIEEQYPFWRATLSPDGLYVAFLAQSDEGYGVHAAQLAPDGLMAPHLVSAGCFNFEWMPESHRLTCGDGSTLFIIEPTGGEKQSVSSQYENYASNFRWSPDGQWLLALFQYYNGINDPNQQTLVALSGDPKNQLTVVKNINLDPDNNAGWSWSGDSQWVAYTSGQFGPRDIFIVNIFDPNSPRQVAPNTLGENFSPQWQP